MATSNQSAPSVIIGGTEYSDFQFSSPAAPSFPVAGHRGPAALPQTLYVSGLENIDLVVFPRAVFIPVFIRCRFSIGSGTATMTIRQLSEQGDEYGILIHSESVGVGSDLAFKRTWNEIRSGAWTFARNDGLKIDWTSPDFTIKWAFEIGIVSPVNL